MLTLSKQLITLSLLSTIEATRLSLNSQEVATLLTQSATKCTKTADTCDVSYNRLMAGNNSEDYNRYSHQNTTLYKDATFPAGQGSLYWGTEMQPKGAPFYSRNVKRVEYSQKIRDIPWARPSEMQSSDPVLFANNETRPSAGQQGQLGDCWLLAAASALAEFPDRVKKIFVNTEYSNSGIFQTKFWIGGEQIKVTVDDRLPTNRQGGGSTKPRTIFSRKSPLGSWWLPILEKSFAKLNVNYANLGAGMMTEAWRQLTNQPVHSVGTKGLTTEQVWNYLSDWDAKNYIISAACFTGGNGLVQGHAYTIIGVKNITLANGTT